MVLQGERLRQASFSNSTKSGGIREQNSRNYTNGARKKYNDKVHSDYFIDACGAAWWRRLAAQLLLL